MGLFQQPLPRRIASLADAKHDDARRELEDWYSRYSDEHGELRGRMNAGGAQLVSASTELFLHEHWSACGRAVQVHPSIAGSTKHPDFLVDDVYVEVVAVMPDRTAEDRLERVAEAVTRLEHPTFGVGLAVRGPEGLGPAVDIKMFSTWLKREMRLLDPRQVPATGHKLVYRCPQGTIDVAVRECAWKQDAKVPIVGCIARGAQWVAPHADALSRLMKKRPGIYGITDQPYVIALASADPHVDLDALIDAFAGPTQHTIRFASPLSDVVVADDITRDGGLAAKNSRLSGVLFLRPPLHGGSRELTLVTNPHASAPCPPSVLAPDFRVDWKEDGDRYTSLWTPRLPRHLSSLVE